MCISRALGAEKPAAKRPRSYMEGPCGRKLSIMSTVLPNTPFQKSKEQMLGFLGGTQGRIKARIMSISRALGQKSQPPNALEATWKNPVVEKQGAKCRRKCARAPPFFAGVPSARAGFFPYIYLSISTHLSLYITYIYIYLSLSLFEQVKLLEKAYASARVRHETATRFLRLLK